MTYTEDIKTNISILNNLLISSLKLIKYEKELSVSFPDSELKDNSLNEKKYQQIVKCMEKYQPHGLDVERINQVIKEIPDIDASKSEVKTPDKKTTINKKSRNSKDQVDME